jgi:nicotinamidase-related amidase
MKGHPVLVSLPTTLAAAGFRAYSNENCEFAADGLTATTETNVTAECRRLQMSKECKGSVPRRELLLGGAAVIAVAALSDKTAAAQPVNMSFQKTDTAVVFIDPQNDVLSAKGANWGAVGASVTENKTVENMERIFKAAKANDYEVFISPHYFYPTDSGWKFNGPLETDEFRTHTFARKGPLTLEGFPNSGADWLDRFKPYIEDGKTIIVSPHKVWGPQTNDLVLQLAKRRISKIILGGMLANICVESHLREFLERGFEVAIVKDATAGPRHPEWGDGYQAAMINYRFLAHAVLSTDETIDRMR